MRKEIKIKMKNNILMVFLIIILVVIPQIVSSQEDDDENYYRPDEGFVPDKETAIKIAEVIWLPIYGDNIYENQPFNAVLSADKKIWTVKGTFDNKYILGGVPYAKIRKKDGKIIGVYHTK